MRLDVDSFATRNVGEENTDIHFIPRRRFELRFHERKHVSAISNTN